MSARSWAMVCSHAPRWTHLEMQFGKEGRSADRAGRQNHLGQGGGRPGGRPLGRTLRVIDYKTGSSWSHGGKSGVYDGGRRFQHLVYVAACRAVLGRAADAMEYHFPTRKGENQIYRYEEESLADGGTLLADMLDGLAKGWFPATDKPQTDCRFCDYKEVCGVHESRRGATTSPHAAWSQRNLKELERAVSTEEGAPVVALIGRQPSEPRDQPARLEIQGGLGAQYLGGGGRGDRARPPRW